MLRITDGQRRARLARRSCLTPEGRAASPVAAAEAVVCLHATEPANAHLSVVARSEASLSEIDAALYEERALVKQLAMRRTVFTFPRSLLPAVWGSAAARVATQQRAQLARDVEKYDVAADGRAWTATALAAVLDALNDGPLTTTELRSAVPMLDARMNISPEKKWGVNTPIAPRVLTTLAAAGQVVRGENAGGWKTSRPRWTRTEQWLAPVPESLTEEAGYAVLVRAWLARFGPGSEADLVWWMGATKSAVRRALADVAATEVITEAGPAYVLPEDVEPVGEVEPWAALVPALDPTTMGWKERGFYLGGHASRIFDANGNAGPTAWWDGRIVGGWTQADDGTVVVVPAEELPAEVQAALDVEAERLSTWLDGEVVRSIYQSPLVRAGTGR